MRVQLVVVVVAVAIAAGACATIADITKYHDCQGDECAEIDGGGDGDGARDSGGDGMRVDAAGDAAADGSVCVILQPGKPACSGCAVAKCGPEVMECRCNAACTADVACVFANDMCIRCDPSVPETTKLFDCIKRDCPACACK